MTFPRSKKILHLFALIAVFCNSALFCRVSLQEPEQVVIIGGGMIGAMEAYYTYCDAQLRGVPVCITVWEKNEELFDTTICNIVPSLTCDEILAVVPRGQELIRKLDILFSNVGGIRVDDVADVHGTVVTEQFKQEAQQYSLDEEGHALRTQALLELGKMSMDLWQKMYNEADAELKNILELSSFNPCCELADDTTKRLHEGYRIDLIYNVAHAQERAQAMKQSYEQLGYTQCAFLTPEQVVSLDPFLADFCNAHSSDNVWHDDAVALWRPGGCIDGKRFLPLLYEYLTKKMGTYTDEQGNKQNCFQVHYGNKVTGVEYATHNGKTVVAGLRFQDGKTVCHACDLCSYVFCPGEAVGTLKSLGFSEPAYAGFAGVSLLLDIEIPQDKLQYCKAFNHCMEVHQEGVVLAWQARFKDNKIFIGVAGTKAFYSDQQPTKHQAFAKNRNLLQLNMINDVLPEFVSWALGYDTHGKTLTQQDFDYLESCGIAKRWAGVRAVVYDGFPTLGCLYKDNVCVENARCTTHLGSGGGSFSHAAVLMSRCAMNADLDAFSQQILAYSDSSRIATH